MKRNPFDQAMEYIDQNIHANIEKIKEGIEKKTGCERSRFVCCFSVLTNTSLDSYIRNRKLYFAAMDLQSSDKSIADIALEWGYSDQTAFSRAMKAYCEYTPGEIKKCAVSMPDERYYLSDLADEKSAQKRRIIGWLCGNDQIEMGDRALSARFLDIIVQSNDLPFDFNTCCIIAELAKELHVSTMAGNLRIFSLRNFRFRMA